VNGRLVDAKDLRGPPWFMPRRMAYRVLAAVGVRVSPRRIVALIERVEDYLSGRESRPCDAGPHPNEQPLASATYGRRPAGVRVGERRLVILRTELERALRGGDAVAVNAGARDSSEPRG